MTEQPRSVRPAVPDPSEHAPAYGSPGPAYGPPDPVYRAPEPAYGPSGPGYGVPIRAYGPPGFAPAFGGPPATAGPFMAERIEPIAGTGFALAYAAVPPVTSGQAVGSMVVGIVATLVAGLELLLGFGGASSGWGAQVGGAFAILAGLLAGAAIVLGETSARTIRRTASIYRGTGLARAGTILGAVAASLAVVGIVGALLIESA